MRIGIVAGEASGDILGAGLIEAIKALHPDCEFEGIGGPLMLKQGFNSLFPMDRLSVMGLVEPLKRLPELLSIRSRLKKHFLQTRPDLVLGIDSPDFTLGLSLALREQGMLTAHYVSPSVWAWRQGRIKKIKRAVDLMLTLFPFEEDFYKRHGVPVVFVGHPLADQIDLQTDTGAARQALGLAEEAELIAMLPGSRRGEVQLLGGVFLATAQRCLAERPALQFLIPAASPERRQQLELMLQESPLPAESVHLLDGDSHRAMAAAQLVLMASGTTTLEAMLLKKPMVVAYKMAPLSYCIISRLLKAPYIALPNLLANQALVPEYLQDAAEPERLAAAILQRMDDAEESRRLQASFLSIHEQLRRNASASAARALLDLIATRGQVQ